MSYINFSKSLDEKIESYGINFEEVKEALEKERKLIEEDTLAKEYKKFFLDGLLPDLIQNYIDSLTIGRAAEVKEPNIFRFMYIVDDKKNKLSAVASYNIIKQNIREFDLNCLKKKDKIEGKEVINYINSVLDSGKAEVSYDYREDTKYGAIYKYCLYCPIETLIKIYNDEYLRYFYIYEPMKYMEKATKIKEKKLKNN